jgi:predicted ArsR family transcriptional regulator
MANNGFNERFLNSTRGRILTLLRRAGHTVEELARELELTDNAVRAHILVLERDGLVRQHGVRPGGGKPAYLYGTTTKAESLFPKPYPEVLNGLLDVLVQQIGAEQSEAAMREVGRRLASGIPIPQGDLKTRMESAVVVLNELGGLAELEDDGDGDASAIQGYSCPLAAVVPGHPQVCKLAESLLATLTGAPMQERCDRDEPWHCRFEIAR